MGMIQQMFAGFPTTAGGGGGGGSDSLFAYVSMLLGGNGTNGANNNTFIDSSANNITITRTNTTGKTPSQGSFTPYSQTGWSTVFDGVTTALTLPNNAAFQPGASDFTMEAWVFPTTPAAATHDPANNMVYFDCDSATNNGSMGFLLNASNQLVFGWYTGTNSLSTATTTGTPCVANTWNHVAVSKVGTTAYLAVNGVVQSFGSIVSTILTGNNPTIGRMGAYVTNPGAGFRYFQGSISNFRMLKGTALYTANFTPSTSPLTSIANTSVLALQSNRHKDNSPNNFTLTPVNSPKIVSLSPFEPTVSYSTATNGGSVSLNGSSDYLNIPSSATFPTGTNTFTIESWVYRTSASKLEYVLGTPTLGGLELAINASGTLALGVKSVGAAAASTGTVPLNVWTHIAAVRSGTGTGGVAYYINGVAAGTGTLASSITQVAQQVGSTSGTFTNAFTGYMTDFRVVNNTVVYSAAFTPPTAPLTAITNTSLLLSAVNAGVIDSSSNNDFITAGSAAISTAQSKYGTGSLFFNGTSDYVYAGRPSPAYDFGTGDFTVEFWVYPLSGPAGTYNPAFYTHNSTGGAAWNANGGFRIHHGNVLFSNSGQLNYSSAITNNVWTHMALVRSGNTMTMYKNGVANGTLTYTIAAGSPLCQPALAISDSADTGGREYLNGYIDDLRITKGIARYTGTFTPPTASFPTK